MQAIVQTTYGAADVLRLAEVDDPAMAPDGVLVEVRAAGVNPVDWKVREGWLRGIFPHHLPLVPGWDVAGVVRQVGPAVQEFAAGDEVYGYVRKDHVQHGTYAELVLAHPRHLAKKPASISFEEAAALPLAALTAMQSLRLAQVNATDTVLVHAAAGGVGAFAVQLAVQLGATVIGTASESNHDFLRDLGAVPVTYGDGLLERVRDAAPAGLSASVDYVGTDEAFEVSDALVTDKRRIISNVAPDKVAALGGQYCFVRPSSADLGQLAELVDAGHVRVEIEEVFPLSEVAAAHARSEGGHVRGKLVLRVG